MPKQKIDPLLNVTGSDVYISPRGAEPGHTHLIVRPENVKGVLEDIHEQRGLVIEIGQNVSSFEEATVPPVKG